MIKQNKKSRLEIAITVSRINVAQFAGDIKSKARGNDYTDQSGMKELKKEIEKLDKLQNEYQKLNK